MRWKKIKLLDVVLENRGPASADEGFDADVAITTGELRGLLPDLIEALGGPHARLPESRRPPTFAAAGRRRGWA